MKDLLKEAIADAKAVRETALANAKLALEEAFTPRLQSMLSAKLAEEMEEEEPTMEEEEETETKMEEGEEETHEEPKMEEGEEEEMPAEEPAEEEMPEEEDDDLDLDEIIKELEGEETEETKMEGEHSEEEEPKMEGEGSEDEEINIDEIIKSLREEEEEKEEMKEEEEKEEMKEEESSEELEEAYNVIRFLKGKINEVNLLNAKLLYSNKLFRNFTLSEGQKMKVIENFDRAFTLREVKLVYSTLAEGFKMPSTKKVVKESFASKPVASTKPAKQVISEGTELANRFKKLAGLK